MGAVPADVFETFIEAAWQNEVDDLRSLAAQYPALADPTQHYLNQALHTACNSGQRKAVRVLIEEFKADVNSVVDPERGSALHEAINCCDAVIAKMLIENGAVNTIRNGEGKTPLEFAREGGKHMAEIIRLLEDQQQAPKPKDVKRPDPKL